MNEQDFYKSSLSRYKEIVSTVLVPKVALYDFFSRKLSVEEGAILQKAPLLFYMVEALYLDIVLTFTKLLDGKRSERNLLRFIDYCESNRTKIQWKDKPLPLDVLRVNRAELRKHENTIENLKIHRDKYFAHSDKDYFLEPEKLNSDFPVSRENIIELLRSIQRLLSAHSHGLNGTGSISMDSFIYVAAEQFLEKLVLNKNN